MKNLFWQKIPDAKVARTVWKDMSDDGCDINIDELEARFGKSQKAAAVTTTKKKTEKKGPVLLLEPKRQQNVGIALARFRMPNDAIVESLLAVDTTVLTAEKISALLNMQPTHEEEVMLQEYEGDKARLGNVEKFVLALGRVPRLGRRLLAMQFKLKFADQVSAVHHNLELIIQCCGIIKEKESVKATLQHILALGNYMNGGTARGAAYGFRLEALTALMTIKASDNKSTLLHFLAKTAQDANAKGGPAKAMLRVVEDLEPMTEAKAVDWADVQGTIQRMRAGLADLNTDIEALADGDLSVDQFNPKMGPFAASCESKISELEGLLATAETDYTTLAKGFSEDPSSTPPQEFFARFDQFASDFKQCMADNEAMRAKEEKAARMLAAKAARDSKMAAATGGAGGAGGAAAASKTLRVNADTESLVDDVLKGMGGTTQSDVLAALQARRHGKQAELGSPVDSPAGKPGHRRRPTLRGSPGGMAMPGFGGPAAMQGELAAALAGRGKRG